MHADRALPHFIMAQDSSASDVVRRAAYEMYEVECWYAVVASGRIRVKDLDPRFQGRVEALLLARNRRP